MAKKPGGSYSQMLAELQEIIDWFEGSEVELDTSIKRYEQANKLIDELEKYLKTAENKIKKVAGK